MREVVVLQLQQLHFVLARGTALARIVLLRVRVAADPRIGAAWKTFLKSHLGAIAATDFFTVEVLTLAGLVRYHVRFVIKLKTA